MVKNVSKTVFVAVFLIIAGLNQALSTNSKPTSMNQPDFAFPKTVQSDAREQLKTALADGRPLEALSAYINLFVASGLISADSEYPLLKEQDSVAVSLPAPYNALGYLLEASVYSEIYQRDQWTYSNRTVEAGMADSVPSFWDKRLFADKIGALVSLALQEKDKAAEMPLKEIESIITYSEPIDSYTVYDFLILKAVELKKTFCESDVIPFFSDNDDSQAGLVKLLDSLLELHPEPCGARVEAVLEKFKLLDTPGEQRRFLWNEIQRMENSPFALFLLTRYSEACIGSTVNFVGDELTPGYADFYRYIESYRDAQTNGADRDSADALLCRLSVPSVELDFPSLVIPGEEFEVKVKSSNMHEFYVLLLECKEDNSRSYKRTELTGHFTKLACEKVHLDLEVPFSDTLKLKFSVTKPGNYTLIASSSPEMRDLIGKPDYFHPSMTMASEIDVISEEVATHQIEGSKAKDTRKGAGSFVVRATDGAPVKGAHVTFLERTSYFQRDGEKETATTDSDGFAPTEISYANVSASFRGSTALGSVSQRTVTERLETKLNLFTDRAVYRPGDLVRFMGILSEQQGVEGWLATDKEVKISVRDANYQEVDSITLKSDSSGRIFGEYRLPVSGLLGSWCLDTKYGDRDIEVAEYKTPSLLVSLEKGPAAPDSIEFRGSVATYSGMPMADTKVEFTVRFRPSHFFYGGGRRSQSYHGQVTTDSDGQFRIILPLGNLDLNAYRGFFTIESSATDGAGETATSSSLPFWLSDEYSIYAPIPSVVEIEDEPLKFNVKVSDLNFEPIKRNVEFTLKDAAGSIVEEGEFTSPEFVLDAAALSSGRYTINFWLKDAQGQSESREVILYRRSDMAPPVDTALWVPRTAVTVPVGRQKTGIRFGSSFPGQHILVFVTTSRGSKSHRWFVSDGTMEEFIVDSPSENEKTFVTFSAFRNHRYYEQTVVLTPEVLDYRLQIKTETFRPSLEAGTQEEWKFTLLYGGKPAEGYAYALLYDKAMEAVAHLYWPTILFQPNYRNGLRLSGVRSRGLNSSFYKRCTGRLESYYQDIAFQTYGYPLFPGSLHILNLSRATGIKAQASMKTDSTTMDNFSAFDMAVEEEADEAPMMAAGAVAEEGSIAEESADFRPIEMPVAFFQPDLVSTPEGEVTVKFTVPNFNTTWNFLLGAYSPSLASASLALETVVSKKVMVKLLPPRFLRTGDKATITATVFNNSDEEAAIAVDFELFNPLTGETIHKARIEPENILPSANRVVALDYSCPYDINSLGIRIFARTETASDGEQTVIPVLPSSQPIVESDPFYIAPEEKEFEMPLPDFPADASVTFKYSDNPLWEVVTALPPIVTPDSENLTSLICSLYANSVGAGLMRNNPTLARGLRMIIDGEAGDSMLVSKLERDADLKTVTLNNTPWVNDAKSETLRMSKLSTLLDEPQAREALNAVWSKIMALRNPDGGWSWCAGMRSSIWMTQAVLINVGLLKQGGYLLELPQLDDAMKAAIGFIEKEYVADYSKIKGDKSGFLFGMTNYLFMRSFFPEITSSPAFASIRREAINHLATNWKNYSIFTKATIALILERDGRKSVAKEIIESLRQFTSENPEKGVWFDNLDSDCRGAGKLLTTARALMAFHAVCPSDAIIDRMRQWLLLQKQAQDWQEGLWSIDAIDALLTTGTSWSAEYDLPKVSVAGKEISPSEIWRLTGEISVNLEPNAGEDNRISIQRSAPSPAWGGVISQFVAPMTSVKADPIADLSIQKEYWKMVDTPQGVEAVKTDTLQIGDKVRISLIVDCGRDMDFVAITDERSACLEPSDQLSGYTVTDGVWTYRETRNSATNLFFDFMPRGRHIFSYECRVMEAGEFSSGVATIQCLYSPLLTAHSAGEAISVKDR